MSAAPPPIEIPAPRTASPARPLRQMVPAELIRIIDGDTVEMRALIWLDQHVVTRVRLRGIDAPERASRCPEEARRADAAAEELERALRGRSLFLTAITRDKYGGRVVARIVTADGADAGEAMLAAGKARAYAGGKRGAWCG
jgi:micrococcal nuclease